MNTMQKISVLFVVSLGVCANARTLKEHEITHETIKSVLSDDLRIKSESPEERSLSTKNGTFGFDFSKVNSSTERPMLNIDMIYDQIDALERYLAGVSAQVQALKAQVREARHVAQEQYETEKKQTQSLLAQLQETREKLNQTQVLLSAADQRQQNLEAQIAQLAQVEKPAAPEVSVVVDNQEPLEIPT